MKKEKKNDSEKRGTTSVHIDTENRIRQISDAISDTFGSHGHPLIVPFDSPNVISY